MLSSLKINLFRSSFFKMNRAILSHVNFRLKELRTAFCVAFNASLSNLYRSRKFDFNSMIFCKKKNNKTTNISMQNCIFFAFFICLKIVGIFPVTKEEIFLNNNLHINLTAIHTKLEFKHSKIHISR